MMTPTATLPVDPATARRWARIDQAVSILYGLRREATLGILDDATLWAEVCSALRPLDRWEVKSLARSFGGDSEVDGSTLDGTDAIVARLLEVQADRSCQ